LNSSILGKTSSERAPKGTERAHQKLPFALSSAIAL
jgi:hypothetical protein